MTRTETDINLIPASTGYKTDLKKIHDIPYPVGNVEKNSDYGYLLCHKNNDSFTAINRLLKKGYDIYWLKNKMEIDGKNIPQEQSIFRQKTTYFRISSK